MATVGFTILAFFGLCSIGGLIGLGLWLWRRSRRAPIALSEPLDIGSVIASAFAPFGRDYAPLWLLAALVVGVPKLVSALLLRGLQVAATGNAVFATTAAAKAVLVPTMISALALMLIGLVFHLAGTHYVLARRAGGEASMAEALGVAPALALPMIAVLVLTVLGLGLASFFLLWPAILLLTSWSVVTPALVGERLGPVQALRRSHALTVGSRGRILLAYIAIAAIGFAIGSAVLAAGRLGNGPTSIVACVVAAATSILTAMLGVGFSTALYAELLRIHGGARSREGLAAIFA